MKKALRFEPGRLIVFLDFREARQNWNGLWISSPTSAVRKIFLPSYEFNKNLK